MSTLETELNAATAERDQLRADRTYNHECINRLAVATGTLGEKSEKVVDVVLSTIDQLRARVERLTIALKDAISTYDSARAETLVTAERQEAWIAALKEDAK